MGYYVNPEHETKEAFLEREGKKVSLNSLWCDVPSGKLPVVCMDKGSFTSATVITSEEELKLIQSGQSSPLVVRFTCYYIDIEKLKDVSDLPDNIQ